MKKNYSFVTLLLFIFCMNGYIYAQNSAIIKKQPAGIAIDGVGDETTWANAEELFITNYLNTQPIDQFDFSSSFKLAWNDTALFFLVMTSDFDIVPGNDWFQDRIELYFKFGSGEVTPPNIGEDQENGVFQVGYRLDNQTVTGGYMPDSTRNHAVTVINDNQDGYVTEGYAAWGQFNNESGNAIIPTNGYTFRFDVNVQDNEDIVEGEEAENLTRAYWSSTSHLWDGDFSTSGVATLSDDVLDPSVVTGLNNSGHSGKLVISPNPVKDIMTISDKVSNILIYNILGSEEVMVMNNVDSGKVSLKSLQEGIYIIRFFNKGDYLGSEKIIKIN